MKHIKSFNESLKEEYYYEISLLDFDGKFSGRREKFDSRDQEEILYFSKDNGLKMVAGSDYIDLWDADHKSKLETFCIFKSDDEWFYVNVLQDDTFYKCDQIDGLIELLKNKLSK